MAMQGMNLMDFFFLRDELLPPEKGLPSAQNTILHDSKEGGTARFSSTSDIDWLDSSMKMIEDEPIAYLGEHNLVATLKGFPYIALRH